MGTLPPPHVNPQEPTEVGFRACPFEDKATFSTNKHIWKNFAKKSPESPPLLHFAFFLRGFIHTSFALFETIVYY